MKRGQEFTAFKLVIAAAFAMALLGIVVGVTDYIQSQAFANSAFGTTFSLLRDAINAPGKCLFRERVVFLAGDEFGESSLKRAGLEKISVTMQSSVSTIACTGSSCASSEKVSVPAVAWCSISANCNIRYGERTCP